MINNISGGLYPDFKLTMKRINGKISIIADYGADEPKQEFNPDTVTEAFHWADFLMAHNTMNLRTCF